MNKIHRLFKWGLWSVAVLCLSGMQMSCNSDDIDADAMYTFTGETVASFCQNDPELSDFYQLITKCGADALLEVYGHYLYPIMMLLPLIYRRTIGPWMTSRSRKRKRLCTTVLSEVLRNILHRSLLLVLCLL